MLIALFAWRKWPRQTAIVFGWWLGIIAACAVIAAPGRMYLRAVGAPVPYDANPLYDVLGLFGGIIVLAAITVVLMERADRTKVNAGQ
jgi:hypothetical protein